MSRVLAWLAIDLVDAMNHDAGEHDPDETGGILLGYWADVGTAVITALVGAGPGARRWATGFVPDATYQEEQLADAYEASGRRLEYLGDWHSHPGARPVPSWQDRRTLRRIASEPGARCPQPLMLILGRRNPRSLRVWIGRAWWRWMRALPCDVRLFERPTDGLRDRRA